MECETCKLLHKRPVVSLGIWATVLTSLSWSAFLVPCHRVLIPPHHGKNMQFGDLYQNGRAPHACRSPLCGSGHSGKFKMIGIGGFPRRSWEWEEAKAPNCQLKSVIIYWMTMQSKLKQRACRERNLYCLKFPPHIYGREWTVNSHDVCHLTDEDELILSQSPHFKVWCHSYTLLRACYGVMGY